MLYLIWKQPVQDKKFIGCKEQGDVDQSGF